MKRTILGLACALITPIAFAQTSSTTTTETTATNPVSGTTTTETTTTKSVGTVSTFTPGKTIVVKTAKATDPVTYTLGKTVTYVTRAGKTIEASMIKPGANVEVVYDRSGPDMVVSRVIVDQ